MPTPYATLLFHVCWAAFELGLFEVLPGRSWERLRVRDDKLRTLAANLTLEVEYTDGVNALPAMRQPRLMELRYDTL